MQTVRPRSAASLAISATIGVLPAPPACRLPTLITRESRRTLRIHPRRTAARANAFTEDQTREKDTNNGANRERLTAERPPSRAPSQAQGSPEPRYGLAPQIRLPAPSRAVCR